MSVSLSRGVVHSLLVLMLWMMSAAAFAKAELPDFADLVEQTSPAVVNISTTQRVKSGAHPALPEGMEIPEGSPFEDLFKHFFGEGGENGPMERDAKSLGSGFIMSADGYIMTNNHVVKDADEILVRLSDRRELKAQVVGLDERSDVALLKIEADNLPVARIGGSKNLKVGEWVLAIGSPFGFDYSATVGIVSAKGRALPRENYVPFIQTDVAINPGNSGGPLFNLNGEVVGVNSQIYSRTGGYMGLSFAIPIEVAMDVAQQLKDKGRVSRGWLGVLIQDVTRDLAESFGMERPKGALVAKVLPESPAERSGIQVGDVIVEFNGKEVVTSGNLPPIVGSTPVGRKVPVRVIRSGKKVKVNVTLGELPDKDEEEEARVDQPEPAEKSRLGLSVMDITEEQRREMQFDEPGVLVQDVSKGAAADAGIRKGDILLQLDNKPVKSVKAFDKLVAKLPAGKSVPVLVQRRGGPIFMAMRVPEKD